VFYGNDGLRLRFHIGGYAEPNSLEGVVRSIYSSRVPAVAYTGGGMNSNATRFIYIDGDDDMLLLTDNRV